MYFTRSAGAVSVTGIEKVKKLTVRVVVQDCTGTVRFTDVMLQGGSVATAWVAFYCRVNHRDRDYEKYLDDVMRRLEEEYGKQKWDLQIFFEEASGADPNRKEFNRLKAEIAAKKIDVVVTMRVATIARNWGQFIEFMLICSKRNEEVVCIDKVEDAQAIFQRIQEFKKRFFEGSDVTCE